MKCSITRKNRDRRGGHKATMPFDHVFGADYSFCTPIEKELIKKISKKKMRRQHKMTHQAINRELNNDWTWQDEIAEQEAWDSLQEWYDDEPMLGDWNDENYTLEDNDWFDDGYDPYPTPDWFMEDDRTF